MAASARARAASMRLGLGYDLVDETELERLARSNRAAGQDQVEGRSNPDEPGKPLGSSCAGEQPELHLGLSELGPLLVVGAHPAATCERELQSAPQAGSVDGSYHRLAAFAVEGFEPAESFLACLHGRLGFGRIGKAGEPSDVGACHPVVWLGRPDHDRPDRVVLLESVEDHGQFGPGFGRERVHRLPGTVNQDGGDSVGVKVECEVCEIHTPKFAHRGRESRIGVTTVHV